MGQKSVQRACAFGAALSMVLATESGWEWLKQESAFQHAYAQQSPELYQVSEGIMTKLCPTKPTPSVLAVLIQPSTTLDELTASGDLFLLADQMVNLDNLGMLLRTIDATTTDGLIMTGNTADPYHWRVARASCGGLMSTPICQRADGIETIKALQKRGIQVVATSANEGHCFHEIDFRRPTAIIIGNEQVGLSRETIQAAEQIACIPMAGAINSLNVTVAGSLMMYEATRQRNL